MKSYGNEQFLNLLNVHEGKWVSGGFVPMALALLIGTLLQPHHF